MTNFHHALVAGVAAAFLLAAPAIAADPKPAPEPVAIPAPPAGKGQIVFYRQGGLGPLISCAVKENDAQISRLPPGRYFVWVAEPGKHAYTVNSEAKDTLNVEVEADETQYARCTITMGLFAGRPNLSPAQKQEFDAASPKLKMVEQKPAAAAK